MEQKKQGLLEKHRTIILARHGDTDLNEDGDKIRGWKNVPLNEHGIEEAYELGERLKKEDFDIIICSDLDRAKETAQAISETTGKPIEGATEVLRPWNLGKFTGQESKTVLPFISEYAEKKPTEKIPEGESFEEFLSRFLGGLRAILKTYPDKKILLVAHHRNDRALEAWLKRKGDNDDIDMPTFLSKGIEPADYKIYKI